VTGIRTETLAALDQRPRVEIEDINGVEVVPVSIFLYQIFVSLLMNVRLVLLDALNNFALICLLRYCCVIAILNKILVGLCNNEIAALRLVVIQVRRRNLNGMKSENNA